MAKIVLDPGHGGASDMGGSSWNNAVGPNGTLEKTLTLDVGLRALAELRARGHDVLTTRDADNNLSLAGRAKVAKSHGAKAFVSIHFNGSTNHNAQGTETLVHKHFSSLSADLSLKVQDRLLVVTGLRDRNLAFSPDRIKPQSLGVLRPSRHLHDTAACLVEVSFLDRADEEERLKDSDYLQRIAVAISDGVEDYLGVSSTLDEVKEEEQGDAIEAEASEAGASVEGFLDLTGGNESPDAEDGESENIMHQPFTSDFVEGGMEDDHLFEALDEDAQYLADFKAFIAGLNLRHFAADEFLFLGNSHHGSGSCKGLNANPPRDLWPNLVNTALMLDEIRARLGTPLRIISGYRNEAYNACVGGATNSFHKQFLAFDVTASAGTPEVWRRVADQVRAEDDRFKGGIGKYISQNFIHVDTRGENVDWTKA